MSGLVRAGEKGVDFSFAKPLPIRLNQLGYTFVVGYISVPPSNPGKNISRETCEQYLNAGLKVLLVWEMTASRAGLGAGYGAIDGANAKIQARERGYPTDIPILVADDMNATVLTLGAHEAYMRAFAAACRPYPIGIYGDTDILERCRGLWRIGWIPNAWSWSGTSRANSEAKAKALGGHVLQRTGFYIDNLWAVDPNIAIADFPAWAAVADRPHPDIVDILDPTPAPVPPLQGDDDMSAAFFEVEGLPGQYLWTPGTAPIPFTNPTDRDVLLKALGVDANSGGRISKEMFDRLTPARRAGDTVDTLARDAAASANAAIARVGQTLGDTKTQLRRAGEQA